MTRTDARDVEIVDVAARDGLQNIPIFVPTATKIALIRSVLAAGIPRLEIGSFVSPKHVPQMADMEAVVAGLGSLGHVRGMALVPNSKGAARALAAGVRDLIFVISMTDSHNQSNVRRRTAASIDDLAALVSERDPDHQLKIRVGIATAFHCPFDGDVDQALVMRHIARIVAIRPGFELALSDTTGMALPRDVAALSKAAIAEFGDRPPYLPRP